MKPWLWFATRGGGNMNFFHGMRSFGRGSARESEALLAIGLASSVLAAAGLSVVARLRHDGPAPMTAWWAIVGVLAAANAFSRTRWRSRMGMAIALAVAAAVVLARASGGAALP